jgi:hypothetical protein
MMFMYTAIVNLAGHTPWLGSEPLAIPSHPKPGRYLIGAGIPTVLGDLVTYSLAYLL